MMRPGANGPAVVDAHDHLVSVGGVAHAGIARDRQRLVRGRHRVHVVGLAAGRAVTVEFLAVPRCQAGLGRCTVVRHRHVGVAGDLVGLVGAPDAQRLDLRDGVRYGNRDEVEGEPPGRRVPNSRAAGATPCQVRTAG